MKNCIVLSGQYRTFDQTWEKIKEFIDCNKLDVYCHLWSTDKTEIQNVQDRLNPIKFVHDDYKNYLDIFDGIDERIRLNNPKKPNQDKLAGNASMNYGRKMAFELVEGDYDNLVYCRYDVGFKHTFIFKEIATLLTPLEESYNLISDIFAIMPFHQAKYYFLYDNYEKLHSTQFEPEFVEWLQNIKKYPDEDIKIHMEQRYCPHMMLLRNLINYYITPATFDLPVYLQR
jgi:hypothetical protein